MLESAYPNQPKVRVHQLETHHDLRRRMGFQIFRPLAAQIQHFLSRGKFTVAHVHTCSFSYARVYFLRNTCVDAPKVLYLLLSTFVIGLLPFEKLKIWVYSYVAKTAFRMLARSFSAVVEFHDKEHRHNLNLLLTHFLRLSRPRGLLFASTFSHVVFEG